MDIFYKKVDFSKLSRKCGYLERQPAEKSGYFQIKKKVDFSRLSRKCGYLKPQPAGKSGYFVWKDG